MTTLTHFRSNARTIAENFRRQHEPAPQQRLTATEAAIAAEQARIEQQLQRRSRHLVAFDTRVADSSMSKPTRYAEASDDAGYSLAQVGLNNRETGRARVYLLLELRGLSAGDDFRLDSVGLTRRDQRIARRLCSWRYNGRQRAIVCRMPSSRIIRELLTRARRMREAVPVAIEALRHVGADVLQCATSWRRWLLEQLLRHAPGRHFIDSLAARFSVSRSTISRDLAALRQRGLQVYANWTQRVIETVDDGLQTLASAPCWHEFEASHAAHESERLFAGRRDAAAFLRYYLRLDGWTVRQLVRTASSYHFEE